MELMLEKSSRDLWWCAGICFGGVGKPLPCDWLFFFWVCYQETELLLKLFYCAKFVLCVILNSHVNANLSTQWCGFKNPVLCIVKVNIFLKCSFLSMMSWLKFLKSCPQNVTCSHSNTALWLTFQAKVSSNQTCVTEVSASPDLRERKKQRERERAHRWHRGGWGGIGVF